MMAKLEGVLYFKIIYSGKPTDYDAVGCDGLYIKSCEHVNKEIALLENVVENAKALADAVNRSPVYHEVKEVYTWLRDALAKLEKHDG